MDVRSAAWKGFRENIWRVVKGREGKWKKGK